MGDGRKRWMLKSKRCSTGSTTRNSAQSGRFASGGVEIYVVRLFAGKGEWVGVTAVVLQHFQYHAQNDRQLNEWWQR
jgi:hypothetical protein